MNNIAEPLDVVHLDLSQGLSLAQWGTQGRGLYCVLWWRDIPLGHLTLSSDEIPVSVSHFAALVALAIAPQWGTTCSMRGFGARCPDCLRSGKDSGCRNSVPFSILRGPLCSWIRERKILRRQRSR